MGNPKITVVLGASNLGIAAGDESGTFGVIIGVKAANTSGLGVPVVIKSKAQAKAELLDALNAPVLAAIQSGFYGEVSEGTPLYCLFVANTTTLAQMVDVAQTNFSKIDNLSGRKLRAVGIACFRADDYVATITTGLDADVIAAVTKAQELATARIATNKMLDVIIEGQGFTNAAGVKDYAATTNPQVHIVIGSEDGNTAFPVLRALGRKASGAVQRNIGRVKSGSLKIADTVAVKLGATLLSTISSTDLDTLHDKRYITYIVNEDAPGYIFNDDISLVASSSDYSTWANNAVIGEAMRIAYIQYYKTLKDDVEVDANGRIEKAIEKNLEQDIIDAIEKSIGGNISGVNALVNPDTTSAAALYSNANIANPNLNLTAGGKLYVFLTIRPKGYIKDVSVLLGFGLN